nr:MAG TPA: hypothetical protein [Caudoviricetes sp.]
MHKIYRGDILSNTCCQGNNGGVNQNGGGFAFILVLFILVILVDATTKSPI